MKVKLVNENFKENYGKNLFMARGILPSQIDDFLNPTKELLNDPINLNNIQDGARALYECIQSDGRIWTCVDCDTDGMCSAAILYNYIKKINPNIQIDYAIHDGKEHGISDQIENLLNTNVDYSLYIITDASSNDGQYIQQLNKTTIVIDHHIVENNAIIPSNMILINNQISENYSNKDACGGELVYQFCRYMDQCYGYNYAEEFIDLAALACVSDMMDMRSLENRYIVTQGFNNISNQFFQTLFEKQSYSMGGDITPITVAFYITPLINSCIRSGTYEEKLHMFEAFIDGNKRVVSHKRGAHGAMEYLCVESARELTNTKARQERELTNIMEQIEIQIFNNNLLDNKIIIVELDDEMDFPSTLNGLLAMKICAKYGRPAIVARPCPDGNLKGSARCPSNNFITSTKDFFMESGYFNECLGHPRAHGISLPLSSIQPFLTYSNAKLADVDLSEKIYDINFERNAYDKDIAALINDLDKYKNIYGQENPEPLIYITDININAKDISIIGKNANTIKFEKNGITYIKFLANDTIKNLPKEGDLKISVIGKPNINFWGGQSVPQIFIDSCEIQTTDILTF